MQSQCHEICSCNDVAASVAQTTALGGTPRLGKGEGKAVAQEAAVFVARARVFADKAGEFVDKAGEFVSSKAIFAVACSPLALLQISKQAEKGKRISSAEQSQRVVCAMSDLCHGRNLNHDLQFATRIHDL